MPSGILTGLPGVAEPLGQLPFGKRRFYVAAKERTQNWNGEYSRVQKCQAAWSAAGFQSQFHLYLIHSFPLAIWVGRSALRNESDLGQIDPWLSESYKRSSPLSFLMSLALLLCASPRDSVV